MIVAGWAWDDRLLALTTLGTVWRVLVMLVLLDLLFVWCLLRLAERA